MAREDKNLKYLIVGVLFLICEVSTGTDLTLEGRAPFDHGVLLFQIHGSESELETMVFLQKMLQEEKDGSVRKLLNYFRYAPQRPVHFWLDEKAERPNGSAGLFPHNVIRLFDFPPLHHGQLSWTHQWFKLLVLHELAHIIHTDQRRGIFYSLGEFFGSIIRPGFWAPAWFIEGVGVWAESQFSIQGRLRSSLLKHELYRRMNGAQQQAARGERWPFCNEIGCLDDPGEYPFGNYAYWAGGYFMDYLEREKPGTIRCLIWQNSSLFPFFANRAFQRCTGQDASQLFDQFQGEFLSNYEDDSFIPREGVLPYREQISWFSGAVLGGSTLYYVYWWEREQFIGAYDFVTQKFRSHAIPDPIETLSYQGDTVWAESYVGRDERGHRRSYQLQEGQFVPLADRDSQYQLDTGVSKVFLSYQSFQWTISDGGGKRRELPQGDWIFHPEVHGGRVYFKLVREGSDTGQIVEMDPGDLSMIKRYETRSGNTFFAGSCEGHVYLVEGTQGGARLVQLSGERPSSWPVNSMIFARFSDEGVFILEKGGARFEPLSCDRYLAGLRGRSRREVSDAWRVISPRPPRRYGGPVHSRPFPSLKHFVPQYWLFDYSSSSGRYLTFKTELTDPKGYHSLKPALRSFSGEQRVGYRVSYTYNPRYFFTGGEYRAGLGHYAPDRRELQAFVGHLFLGESWSYRPQLFVEDRVDSDRTEMLYGLTQRLRWSKKRRHQVLDHLYLGNTSYRSREGIDDYWAVRSKLSVGWNFSERWRSRWRLAYSRVLGEERVFLQGGGQGEIQDFHNFYGLDHSSLKGNTITSGGVEFYQRWSTPYKQSGFFPLQWQELGGVLGSDYAAADIISIDDELLNDTYAYSIYGGLRARVKIFYRVLTDLNFLASEVRSGHAREQRSSANLLFFLSGYF